jgi:hypothetical protein
MPDRGNVKGDRRGAAGADASDRLLRLRNLQNHVYTQWLDWSNPSIRKAPDGLGPAALALTAMHCPLGTVEGVHSSIRCARRRTGDFR